MAIPQVSRFKIGDVTADRAQDQARGVINQTAKSLAKTQAAAATASGVNPLAGTSGSVAFDASKSSHFTLTLTGNVTSSSITGLSPGQVVTFVISQDATGGRTFAWPTYVNGNLNYTVRGAGTIGAVANKASSQRFMFDGSTLWAIGSIVTGL
jgi:hypothetical protein